VAVVETVRGPVDLGQTLMHEHVYVLSTEHVQNYGNDWWDEEAMASGVTQEQIDMMMVENPVRYFTSVKGGAS
jgi:predicted metal-dependent phosphotriesterase family hydrolase